MLALKRMASIALVAGSAAVAACGGDSLSPDTVDPLALSDDLGGLSAAIGSNPSYQSMRLLALSFPAYGASSLLSASLDAVDAVTRTGPLALSRVGGADRLLAGLRAPAAGAALFPNDVLGKTLVWDVDSVKYVVSNLTGAPANGIRLLLYVADPSSGQPSLPLQPVGTLDLTDESSAAANKLGVLVKLGGLTLADYDITATVTTTSATVRARGFVRSGDGSEQVDFDITLAADFSGASISVIVEGSDGTLVRLIVQAGSSASSVLFSVSHSGNTIALDFEETTTATVSGTIRFNGTTVATLSGPSGDPIVAPVQGHTLTGEEIAAIEEIFAAAGDLLLGLLEGIFAPAGIVFGSLMP